MIPNCSVVCHITMKRDIIKSNCIFTSVKIENEVRGGCIIKKHYITEFGKGLFEEGV